MDKDFLTVSDFAERAGVSKQAVYKRIGKDLKPFSRTVNGVKYISAGALSMFATKDKPAPAPDVGGNVTAYLIGQLQEKDNQIESLSTEIRRLNQQIATQAGTITEILKKQNDLYLLLTERVFHKAGDE